jgi:Sigma-70 region 2
MSDSPAPAPSHDDHQRLHQRLLDRDPTASADLAAAFLEPLIRWLGEHNPTIHSDLLDEAAAEAILALIRNPASYQPQRGGLETYLRMSAQGDLRNLLRREARHHCGRDPRDVALLADDGKCMGREDDPALGLMIEEEMTLTEGNVPDVVRAGLTEVEARVLDLMLCRERRTSAYAEVCGYTEHPPEEQRRLVKQMKDRLKMRIKRAGGS